MNQETTFPELPMHIEKVVQKSIITLNTNDRAGVILLGIKEHCPNLYKQIKETR